MSENGTTILFGLPGGRVHDVQRLADGRRLVHLRTDEAGASACPDCGVLSSSVRQRRTTRPRDIEHGGGPVDIHWRKAQYACKEALCGRKAFTEQTLQIPARARLTRRLREHVAGRVADGLSVSRAAGGLMSWPVAQAAFGAHADAHLGTSSATTDPPPATETGAEGEGGDARGDGAVLALRPVRVLGIDETRRGKPVWTQNPDTGRWTVSERFETNFVDLTGDGTPQRTGCPAAGQGLLGQTAGRTAKAVVAWLAAQPQEWRDGIEVVAMDPSPSYRAAIREALPHALIVADHFHLVRLGNQMVTDVRRRVTWDTKGRRGRKTDPAWAARRRLLRGYERLTDEQFTRMWNGLVDGDPTHQILRAWIGKEQLRGLLATARTGGTRHDVAHRLTRFYAWCADSGVPELVRLASTVEAWWPEILGFLTTNITNAGTEATNRTIKTVARTAYGFRNLDNQRQRVRFACTPRPRGVIAC